MRKVVGGFFLGGGRGRGLQAGVDFNFAQTGLAFDRATPVEFAHAALGPSLAMALVAAVAAQQVAAVDRLRRLVAGSSLGTERSGLLVELAVGRRTVQIHQIGVGVRFVGWTAGH